MRRFATLVVLVALFAGSLATSVTGAGAQEACHPIETEPEFGGTTPTGKDVLGFDIGTKEVTVAESDRYLGAVDAASDRVVTGSAAISHEGRSLKFAIVGRPENVTTSGLAQIRADAAALRDPQTTDAEAATIVERTPAILWIASNVHGGEESGTDASLRVLYELADREDCAADQILDNSLVVLLPIQNPDGREADTRRNHYGFDMNRDWFARTQPETDGKIELLRDYPPVLFVDDHEMGSEDFFFPPNADPIYHEITDESVDWINNTYGAALADEFTRQGIPYFNRSIYDLFYMGYGDTVPSTGFIAAGMTYEKSSGDPINKRTYEQYVAQWISLTEGAVAKESILTSWHDAYVEAYQQGQDGFLEPNEIVNPGNEVVTEVPTDPLRHYFVRNDNPNTASETQALIRRLQRMDVEVYQLTEPLTVPDYTPYARASRNETLPAGTYWIPMAQAQKHWVQAMLNEDTYTPFPYFYDVTGWSSALLFNVDGGYSGTELSPVATPVGPMAQPPALDPPSPGPAIAVYQISAGSTASIESTGWLRYLLEQVWDVPYRDVTAKEIARGGLSDVDVLLVGDGSASTASKNLGKKGRNAIMDWTNDGGRYVGWRRGGGALAARIGLSTAQFAEPTSDVPGSLFRVAVDPGSPLADGVGPFAWAFYEYDLVMTSSDPDDVAVRFPAANSEDFFVSGFAEGEEELGGTAAVVDEAVGTGRSVVFSFEPNFRAFTDGTQEILFNAIYGDDASAARAPRAGAASQAAEEDAARRAARRLVYLQSPIRLSVRPASASRAERIVGRFTDDYLVRSSRGRVSFVIANRQGLSGDEHPFALKLGRAVARSGVRVIAYSLP
jgi:Zinc carboxypeptidase